MPHILRNAVSLQHYATMLSCPLEKLGSKDVAANWFYVPRGLVLSVFTLPSLEEPTYRKSGSTNEVLATDMLRGLRSSNAILRCALSPARSNGLIVMTRPGQ
jgi:hypothetical protein